MDTAETRLVHLNLPRELLADLRELAERQDRSLTAEIKRAAAVHVAGEKAIRKIEETGR